MVLVVAVESWVEVVLHTVLVEEVVDLPEMVEVAHLAWEDHHHKVASVVADLFGTHLLGCCFGNRPHHLGNHHQIHQTTTTVRMLLREIT